MPYRCRHIGTGSTADSTPDVYRIVVDGAVDDQLDHLPRQALLGYADVLTVLEEAPGGGRPYNDAVPEGPMRQYVFGPNGEGLVTYLVLEREREVHVLLVEWI